MVLSISGFASPSSSISLPEPEYVTDGVIASRGHKRTEIDKVEQQPISRIEAIFRGMSENFKDINDIVNIVIHYDQDTTNEIIGVILKGDEISKAAIDIARNVDVLDFRNYEE